MYNYYPQPNANQFTPSIQMPQTNVNWIRVNGIESAKSQVVPPNSTMWFMNTNEPIFYVKTADNLGVSTIKAYRFEEITSDTKETRSEYVTKEEIENIIEAKINELAKRDLEV